MICPVVRIQHARIQKPKFNTQLITNSNFQVSSGSAYIFQNTIRISNQRSKLENPNCNFEISQSNLSNTPFQIPSFRLQTSNFKFQVVCCLAGCCLLCVIWCLLRGCIDRINPLFLILVRVALGIIKFLYIHIHTHRGRPTPTLRHPSSFHSSPPPPNKNNNK